MADAHLQVVGLNQRRYRTGLAEKGWRSISTYMTAEHRKALEQIQRQHGLTTLHEALELALSSCPLPPFTGAPTPSFRTLPCLTVK